MHPSGRQSGNFPGRLGVGKELYSWPIKVSEYEHITELEEQIWRRVRRNVLCQ